MRLCLVLLALLATLAFVRVAQAVLLPLVLAILGFFVLSPVVQGMARLGLPAVIGASLVLLLALGGLVWTVLRLHEPLARWAGELPQAVDDLQHQLRSLRQPVEEVSEATEELSELVGDGSVPAVQVKGPSVLSGLLIGTGQLTATLGVSFVLLFLLLAHEENMLHRLTQAVSMARGRPAEVALARQVRGQVSSYLLTITVINAGLGVAVGLAVTLLEMPNGLLWGLMAALMNYVPYLGALIGVVVMGLASFVVFGDLQQAIWPPLVYLALTVLEGNIVTPLVLGHRLVLSPFVIFLWLVLWSWLWGIAGMIIAVPVLIAVRITAANVDALKPLERVLTR